MGEAAALGLLPANPHVMPLLEAMEDEEWSYLVFPYAEEELFEVGGHRWGRSVRGCLFVCLRPRLRCLPATHQPVAYNTRDIHTQVLVSRYEQGMPEAEVQECIRQLVLGLLHMKRHGLAHGYGGVDGYGWIWMSMPRGREFKCVSCLSVDMRWGGGTGRGHLSAFPPT